MAVKQFVLTNAETRSNSSANREQAGASQRNMASTSIAIAMLVAITLASFWGVTRQDFVHWDDKGNVYGNPFFHHIDKATIVQFWQTPYEHLYIPLSYTVYALLCMVARMPSQDASITNIGGLLNPHVFHAANLLLHLGNVLLVFWLLRRVVLRMAPAIQSPYPACFGALLFAVHPLQVESVAWITELRGQLASIFCLGTLCAYVSAVKVAGRTPWKTWRYWFGLLLSILGLLCKPSIVIVGLLLFVLDRWMLQRPWRSALTSSAPWLALAVPFILYTKHVQSVDVQNVPGALWQRPFVAGDALAFYLEKLFLPIHLGIEYGRRPDYVLQHSWTYVIWLFPAAAALAVFVLRKRWPWLMAGALFSLSVVLPVLGLLAFAYQNYSTVADRYCYLALIGPAFVAATALAKSIESGHGKLGFSLATLALSALMALTLHQVKYWDNSATLFAHGIEINPGSYGLRTNYGLSLADLGRSAEAMAQYQKAAEMYPDLPDAWQDMGITLQQEGRRDQAEPCFRHAIQCDPDAELGHAALGFSLLTDGMPGEALTELEHAAKINPVDAENLAHTAAALEQLGRGDEAVAQYHRALAVEPENIAALTGLAELDANSGRLGEAETEGRRALRLAPRNPKTHATLGDILQKKGGLRDALAEYREAVQLDPTVDVLHFMLGSALFKSGDHTGAIPELKETVRLGPTAYHHDQLGVAYATVGNMAEARQEFEAALRTDPNFALAQQHIAMLESTK